MISSLRISSCQPHRPQIVRRPSMIKLHALQWARTRARIQPPPKTHRTQSTRIALHSLGLHSMYILLKLCSLLALRSVCIVSDAPTHKRRVQLEIVSRGSTPSRIKDKPNDWNTAEAMRSSIECSHALPRDRSRATATPHLKSDRNNM